MRYDQLNDVIRIVKPKTIIETGTWNGDRAIQMASEALKHRKEVHYHGFDLFEMADEETDARELNVKDHFSAEEVAAKLQRFSDDNPGFSFDLYQGDTKETLEKAEADFVFLDGGHSVETIDHDFNAVRGSKCIVLDDYYIEADGKRPDIKKFGCNLVLEQAEHMILPQTDPVRDGGGVKMAVVCAPEIQPELAKLVGPKNLKVKTRNCVPDKNIQANVKYSTTLCDSWVEECAPHDLTAVICSAGPSLNDHIEEIRKISRSKKNRIFCVKHSHDVLIDNRIVPYGCLLLDPRAHVQDFIETPHPKVRYFAASMCHPSTWDQLIKKEARIFGYHAKVGAGEEQALGDKEFLVAGGSTSASRGIILLYILGFRRFVLYGFDSCYREKPIDKPKAVKIECAGRKFWTDPELIAQSDDLKNIFKMAQIPDIEVRGDGLIAHMWNVMKAEKKEFTALYD